MFENPSRLSRSRLVAGIAFSMLACTACTAIPQTVLDKAQPLAERSTILAADGSFLASVFRDENRQAVSFNDIPKIMKEAIISAEDSRFYSHGAIDMRALVRALVTNVGSGDVLQGGSTITQQLAKLMYGQNAVRNVKEKILEARIAIWLEQRYTKDQILTQYLNRAYFGHQSYGISAAANTYFAEPLSKLTLSQAALIAGLVKEPTTLDPFEHPDAAKIRRAYVLDRMVDSHYVTQMDADAAKAALLGVRRGGAPKNSKPKYGPDQFFVSYVQQELLNDPAFGATEDQRAYNLYNGGLTIHTTLYEKWNQYAWQAIQRHLGQPGDPEAAIVAIDTHTGAVRAMIGGDYRRHEFNYAAQGGRQPGSSFKPFVLAAALSEGISPDSRYDSSPGKIYLGGGQVWDVHNSDGQGHGFITIHEGLIGSVNALFARLVLDVGPSAVADMAAKAGITRSELTEPECNCVVPSIALGAKPVSPLDMASAYSTFADNGMHYQPHGISLAQDQNGKVLFDETNLAPKQTMDPAVAYEVTKLLQDVVKFGTGTAAQISGRVISGKTGTNAPDHGQTKDVWFVGYTPDVVTAVWVGYPCVGPDGNKYCPPMYSVHGLPAFGGTVAAPIWHDFMMKALADMPRDNFTSPNETLVLHIHNGKPPSCTVSASPSASAAPSPVPTAVGNSVDSCPTPSPSPAPTGSSSGGPAPSPFPSPSSSSAPEPSPSAQPSVTPSAQPSPTPSNPQPSPASS